MTLHQAQLANSGLLALPMAGLLSAQSTPVATSGSASPLSPNGETMQRKRSRDDAFSDIRGEHVLSSPSSTASLPAYCESPSMLVRTRKRVGCVQSDTQRATQSQETVQRLLQAARRQPLPEPVVQAHCITCGTQGSHSLLNCAGCASTVCRTCSMTVYQYGDSFDACLNCAHPGGYC